MLTNEFVEYLKKTDYFTKNSILDIKVDFKNKNNDISADFSKRYVNFLHTYMFSDVKVLDDYYYEANLPHLDDVQLTQQTIDHVQEKSHINIKAVKNTDKLVQYGLYCFTYNDDKIDKYDFYEAVKNSTYHPYYIYYIIIKFCIERYGQCDDTHIRDIFFDHTYCHWAQLRSYDQIQKLCSSIVGNIANTADTSMKQKLVGLMEKANITNYELEQLTYTEDIPKLDHWTGYYVDGEAIYDNDLHEHDRRTITHDYGWVVIVKDLGWKIATDGNKFYITSLSGSTSRVIRKHDLVDLAYDASMYKPSVPLTEEKIIEYLTTNTMYEPTVGYVKVNVSRFNRSDNFERIVHLMQSNIHPEELEECESIELVPEHRKVFYIKFKFMTKKSIDDITHICDDYAYKIIKKDTTLRNHIDDGYGGEFYMYHIKFNHFKLGEVPIQGE